MFLVLAITALSLSVGFPPSVDAEIICSQLTPVPCGVVEADDCWGIGMCNAQEFENIGNTTFQVIPASGGNGHYIYESNGAIIPCWKYRGCEEQMWGGFRICLPVGDWQYHGDNDMEGVGECTVNPVVVDPIDDGGPICVDELTF